MLDPGQQAEFVAEQPDIFLPVPGGWGRNGATHMRLAAADEDSAARRLHTAWKLRVEKNAGNKNGIRKNKSGVRKNKIRLNPGSPAGVDHLF